jgi:enterobacterial common antigen flippase
MLSLLLGFAFSILLARVLGPELRGEYGQILLVATLIAGITQFGLGHGYIYHSRANQSKGGVYLLEAIGVIGLTVLVALLIFLQFGSTQVITIPILLLVALTLSQSWFQFTQNAVQIQPSLTNYNLTRLVLPACSLIGFIVCLAVGLNINVQLALSFYLLATLICIFIAGQGLLKKEKANQSSDTLTLSECINYSLKHYGTALTGLFIMNIDKVFVWIKGSTEQFGFYIVAYGLSRLMSVLPETLSTVLFSKFAGTNSKNLSAVTSTIFSLLFLPLFTLALCASLSAPWLIPFVFGDAFSASIVPFMFLAIESILSGFSWLLAQRFNSDGRPGLVLARQVFSLMPLFVVFFYEGDLDLIVVISIALLLSALMRLFITFLMYNKVLNEAMPAIIPKRLHIDQLKKALKG